MVGVALVVGGVAGVSSWPVVVGRLVGDGWFHSVEVDGLGLAVPGWSQRLVRRCVALGFAVAADFPSMVSHPAAHFPTRAGI